MKDYERLTVKSEIFEDNNYVLKGLCTFGRDGIPDDETGCKDYCEEKKGGYDCETCVIQMAFNRLAEYENTGLSPEEVQKLKSRQGNINGRG